VRKEWAGEHGLPVFASDTYSHAMDAVCQRLGVSEGVPLDNLLSLLTTGMII